MMKKLKKTIKGLLLWLSSTLLLLCAGAAVFFALLYHGPSVHYRQRFVREQIAAGRQKLLVDPFLSEEELSALLKDVQ